MIEDMSQVNQNRSNYLNMLSMALSKALHKLDEVLINHKNTLNKGLRELGKLLKKALQ